MSGGGRWEEISAALFRRAPLAFGGSNRDMGIGRLADELLANPVRSGRKQP